MNVTLIFLYDEDREEFMAYLQQLVHCLGKSSLNSRDTLLNHVTAAV